MTTANKLAKALERLLVAKEDASQCRLAMTGEDADLSKDAELRLTAALILVESRFKQAREALTEYRQATSSMRSQLASA